MQEIFVLVVSPARADVEKGPEWMGSGVLRKNHLSGLLEVVVFSLSAQCMTHMLATQLPDVFSVGIVIDRCVTVGLLDGSQVGPHLIDARLPTLQVVRIIVCFKEVNQ